MRCARLEFWRTLPVVCDETPTREDFARWEREDRYGR
jgi:hypothetical protein